MDFKESFAEFQGSSEVHEGVLITKRRLLLKASEVMPDQLKTYKAFRQAIADDHATYIYIRIPAHPSADSSATRPAAGAARIAELLSQMRTQLPGSSISEALQAEEDSRKSWRSNDYPAAIAALKRTVSLDPNFTRAWIELGAAVMAGSLDKSSAPSAFQKAIDIDPKQIVPYKLLALTYMFLGKLDNAVATWQRVQSIVPGDPDVALNLGRIYVTKKRYSDAVPLFESLAKTNPSDAYAHMRVGVARLFCHDTEEGLKSVHRALEIDSGPEMLNNAAYEMAETSTSLPEALGYSERSIKQVEERSQRIDLSKIQPGDLQLTAMMAAYWDTLGWIYFKMGDLSRAESYLTPSWQLVQDGVVGDHLGQVYEKEKKLPAAVRMYNLALEANPRLEDTPSRMRNLAHVPLPKNRISAREDLNRMRTIQLPPLTKGKAQADFTLLLVASGQVVKANFSGGSELLRHAGESLEKTVFPPAFPAASTAQLVRQGKLSCSAGACSFSLNPISLDAVTN
jgi:tetratricopeptide (TPR) repeat protein